MNKNQETRSDFNKSYVLETLRSLFAKYQILSNEVIRLRAELERRDAAEMRREEVGPQKVVEKENNVQLKEEIEKALLDLDECIELLNK